jgi:hypothetical protein
MKKCVSDAAFPALALFAADLVYLLFVATHNTTLV